MTAIAYRDGIMAADSVGWTCGSIKMPVEPKIKRTPGGDIFAAAGKGSEIARFTNWMLGRPGRPCDDFDKDEGFCALWLKSDGSIWLCTHDVHFYLLSVPFFAIGSPNTFMMGALYAGATAEQAVRLAILHTDGAGGDVQVERVGISG